MTRFFDIVFSALGLLLVWPALALIFLMGLFDTGSPFFLQQRVGRHQHPFVLVKFRTMRLGTPSVATHLADASKITRLGSFLRRTKLDELPQLWNVLKGDMSLVGPRPCLFSQTDLIVERASRGVFDVRPGITGWAQIQGIDMSTPQLLAEADAVMLSRMSMHNYFKYIFKTVLGAGSGDIINPS
jgi:O-antigen biosynthesis protein WbqP